jgi:hypothetical protein
MLHDDACVHTAYVQKEQWDKCRTVVNTPPLGFTGQGSLKDNLEKVFAPFGMRPWLFLRPNLPHSLSAARTYARMHVL